MKIKKLLTTLLMTSVLCVSSNAATFITVEDLATILEIEPSERNIRLKDTSDQRFITMYDYGMIQIVNGCAEPNRHLTNGEIVAAVVSYYDALNGTSYSLETNAPYVYPTYNNLTKADIVNILADLDIKSKTQNQNTINEDNDIIKW